MRNRILLGLLSGAIGISVTGCAGTSPVMRAQSPQYAPAGWDQTGSGVSCDACQYGASCDACQGYDENTLINLPCHPVHRNSFTYNTPHGLMYPPSPTPAAVYQYPYYTFRGPTDFFME